MARIKIRFDYKTNIQARHIGICQNTGDVFWKIDDEQYARVKFVAQSSFPNEKPESVL